MVDGLKARGVHVIWRCHIGSDLPNEFTNLGWAFLRDHISGADFFVFSRAEYPPEWLPQERIRIIPPSVDPYSQKNVWLSQSDVHAALRQARLVDAEPAAGQLAFTRRDGSGGVLRALTAA